MSCSTRGDSVNNKQHSDRRPRGIKQDVQLDLVDGATVGHYVLVHVGYAIQLMTPAEAKETFALFSEYADALEQELEGG